MVPILRRSLVPTSFAFVFLESPYAHCVSFPSACTAVCCCRRRSLGHSRQHARPGHVGPPRHELRLPTGARVPWVLPRHSTAVGATSADRSRGPAKPLLRLGEQEREKNFALEFEKREGSFCKVVMRIVLRRTSSLMFDLYFP